MSEVLNDNELALITQRLQALAQTGLTYTKDAYDRERYEELMGIAERMLTARFDLPEATLQNLHKVDTGYATPKTDVRAIILHEGKLLMVQEADDKGWSLPGGWADIGDSPTEAVEREQLNERIQAEVPEAENSRIIADFKARTEELFNGINGQTQDDIEQTVWAYLHTRAEKTKMICLMPLTRTILRLAA